MAEINILESAVFNRIAAGEVVENPRSIVKELIENSIDAGAKRITLEIKNGGIDFIKITDDGKGLNKEDLPLAFMPHATSKLNKLADLDAISTLGFRGEALPSIASIAKITMISRKEETELGYKICFENARKIDEGEAGCALGTTVIVENVFKNIPARAKFLKKSSSEEADISDLIIKFILANPMISIKYIINDVVKYHSSGEGKKSAIYSVYGDIMGQLTAISDTMPDIILDGYVSIPSYTKHNRTYQTLIVNGRYVINSEISFCIQQAFQNFLMKRQFPMYVLYINLPLDMVDVNVHPNKMEVKFVNFKKIKGYIYNLVKTQLDKEACIPKDLSEYWKNGNVEKIDFSQDYKNEVIATELVKTNESQKFDNTLFSIFNENNFTKPRHNLNETSTISMKLNDTISNSNTAPRFQYDKIQNDYSAQEDKDTKQNIATNTFLSSDEAVFVGKLFNTYLMYQENDTIFLIDQHAAHEKILYDKMVNEFDNSTLSIQDLLIPYIFDVTNSEKVILDNLLSALNELGFVISSLSGLSYSLSGIPMCCANIDLEEFVSLLLTNLDNKLVKKSEFLKEHLMQAACKSAVKGEMDLSENEIDKLINQIKAEGGALFCPHGRPTIVSLTRNEIEKWFKRIV